MEENEEKPQIARLIIEYDPAKNVCRTILEGQFPIPNLVYMLEVEKQKLIINSLGQIAQAAAQKPRVLDLNGMPLPNFRGR